MNTARAITKATPAAHPAASRVLYVGAETDEICMHLADSIGEIDLTYKTIINDAFVTLREQVFDVIVLDLRSNNPAIQLALPIICSIPRLPRVVVICQSHDLSSYLRLRGVWRVLTEPLKGEQLQRAVTAQLPARRKPKPTATAPQPEAPKPKPADRYPDAKPAADRKRSILDTVFGFGMSIVSTLYKRAAFVLLAALFSAFLFYGVLIVFFLLSNSWAAPMTLTKGNEVVARAEAELNQLQVSLNLTKQRIAENKLNYDIAQQTLAKAQSVVAYSLGTVDKQTKFVKARSKTLERDVTAQRELVTAFASQIEGGEFNRNLKRLYDKRLIDKTTYQSGMLGLLEAKQRMQAIQSQLSEAEDELSNIDATLGMLNSLRDKLQGKASDASLSATSTEMMQLVTQSLEARASVEASQSEIANSLDKREVLERSLAVLQNQIAELQATPMVRAANERIDVLYVPYGNENNFTQGRNLVSCALTIVWCSDAGTVGQRFPGESTGVHPFFGKPIRGFFVEVHLTDKAAATQEIIHANRAPLFF
jgi:hypothetical protein